MTRCRLGESPTLQSLPPLPEKGDNCISWVPMRSMWDKPPRDCVSPQGSGPPLPSPAPPGTGPCPASAWQHPRPGSGPHGHADSQEREGQCSPEPRRWAGAVTSSRRDPGKGSLPPSLPSCLLPVPPEQSLWNQGAWDPWWAQDRRAGGPGVEETLTGPLLWSSPESLELRGLPSVLK